MSNEKSNKQDYIVRQWPIRGYDDPEVFVCSATDEADAIAIYDNEHGYGWLWFHITRAHPATPEEISEALELGAEDFRHVQNQK